MARNCTDLFASLLKKINLSNKVSQKALLDASEQWHAYKKCDTALRDPHQLIDILAKLTIVLNQVAWCETRIEPTQWHAFCELHTAITTALRTGQPLEPHEGNKKANPTKSANDDSIMATALQKAINQANKRQAVQAVA